MQIGINNTFYHLPAPGAFEKWRRETPENFLFAVKANRYITHMKKLKHIEASLALLYERVLVLHRKLGPILFQLPPGWNCNYERLSEFLKLLPGNRRHAFEFRNASWINNRVLSLLERHNIAFCIYDLAGMGTEKIVTADWVYIRLHGPDASAYSGKYAAAALAGWAEFIDCQAAAGRSVFCYFDNDQNAYAPQNAAELA
ncbi:MAG: DUF72 domain-containing protein [Victivallaceae bacterium]|nr:DUF72 domain-containing protein [Victivallaceae bacterium]